MRKRIRWEPFGPFFLLLVFIIGLGIALAAFAGVVGVIDWLISQHWTVLSMRVSWFAAAAAAALVAVGIALSRRVVPSIWSLMVNTGALLVLARIVVWPDKRFGWEVVLLSLLALFLFSLGNKAHRADVSRGMRRRSERATRTVNQVLAGVDPLPRYALYLRPFSTSDRLPAQTLPSVFEGSHNKA
jgi:hypothetical protein